jgi:isoleucyl-tRNA synthetase
VLDEQGRKMSKSLGNVTAPQQVIEQYGADILRLWVVSSDYSEDLRIGPEILKQQAEYYRRLRNTLRYLLGALDGFAQSEKLPFAELPELERLILHRLRELDLLLRESLAAHDFTRFYVALHNFCAVDLSAFYFDIRKDALYCDKPESSRRRATRTLMDIAFDCLAKWLAPVLCFTAEEAWLVRHPGDGESVHLQLFPETPAQWTDTALAEKWAKIRELRRVVTGAIELARGEKKIGSSLQASPVLHLDDSRVYDSLPKAIWDEVIIVSAHAVAKGAAPEPAFRLPEVPGVAVRVQAAPGNKCERCWRVLPEVGSVASRPTLCVRCADAVG